MRSVTSLLLCLLLSPFARLDASSCVTDLQPARVTPASGDGLIAAVAAGTEVLGTVMADPATGGFRFVRRSFSLEALDAGTVVAPSGSRIARLVFDGEEWSLFYRNTESRIVRQRISSLGVLHGPAVVLFPGEPGSSDDALDVEITTDGGFVIARTISAREAPGMAISRFTREGVLVGSSIFYGPQSESPIIDLEPIGTGWVVIFDRRIGVEEQQSLFFYDGSIDFVTSRSPDTGARGGFIEYDGEKLVLVARKGGTSPGVYAWILTSTGELESETRILTIQNFDVQPIDLLSQGTDFAFFYQRSEGEDRHARMLRFSRSGDDIVVGPDVPFAQDEFDVDYRWTSLPAWTGRSWVMGVVRSSTLDGGPAYWIRSVCPLQARILGLPSMVEWLQTVTLSVDVEGGRGPYQVTWTLDHRGEDIELFGTTVEYRFIIDGEVEVRALVRDTLGQTFVAKASTVVVLSLPPLQASFSGPVAPVQVNQSVVFSAAVSNAVDSAVVTWSLGDGRSLTGTTVTASYPRAGTYAVGVEVRDAAGRVVTGTLTVVVEAPVVVEPARRRLVERP